MISAAAAAGLAGVGGGSGRAFAGGEDTVAAGDDAADGGAGVGVGFESVVFHALADFVMSHFAAGFGGDGFVKVSGHGVRWEGGGCERWDLPGVWC